MARQSGWRTGESVAIAALCALVAGAKLALTAGRPLCPRALPHDDLLFVDQARALMDGGWLGGYSHLALIKGPFLSMFLAAGGWLGVPYLIAVELAYLSGCAVMVLALAPLVRPRLLLPLLFAVCVFNPATLSSDPTVFGVGGAVITREPLYGALTLLVLGSVIGMWTHRAGSGRVRLAWSVSLGLALGAFWLTREEGVWILPSLGLGLAACAWPLGRRGVPRRVRAQGAALVALPLFLWGGAVLLVAVQNWRYYGVFIVTEMHAQPFRAAYGALTRVRHPQWKPNIPVPEAVRLQLYQVSPSFQETRRYLEDRGSGWYGYGCPSYPHTCGDLPGGWFPWAFRDAVSGAGHHASAGAAAAYYRRLAREINDACDQGRLDCDPPRETLLDPIRWYHVEHLPATVARAVGRTLRFADVHIVVHQCEPFGGKWVEYYPRVAHHSIDPPAAMPAAWRVAWSSRLLDLYGWLTPPLAALALLGYLASLLALPWLRSSSPALPATIVLVAIAVRFVLLGLVDLVATTPYAPRYYQPVFPLVLLFIGINAYGIFRLAAMSLAALGRAVWRRRASPDADVAS